MRELERELRALPVDWPPTPEVAAAVRARIASEPQLFPRRARFRPRTVVAALLVVLVGGIAAVEPARSALLELLGLHGVRIERRQPEAPPRPQRPAREPSLGTGLRLGEPVTVAAAARRAGFDAAPPADPALGRPDAVFFHPGPPAGGRVAYVYGPRPALPESRHTGVGLLVTQFVATVARVIEKAAGPGVRVERLEVDGDRAFFLSGRPHGFAWFDERRDMGDFEDQRLAGKTLLVERNGLLLRIEGEISRSRAIEIARSVSAAAPANR